VTPRPSDAMLLVLCAESISRHYNISFNQAVEWLRSTQWPKVVSVLPPEQICEH
jgi:hypothetical protein